MRTFVEQVIVSGAFPIAALLVSFRACTTGRPHGVSAVMISGIAVTLWAVVCVIGVVLVAWESGEPNG